MKKIIVFSVALLIGVATYAYSLPLVHHGIEQGVYSGRVGDVGRVGQGFNLIPWSNSNMFSSSMFGGVLSFAPQRHVAGLEYAPGFPEYTPGVQMGRFIISSPSGNVGDTDPIPEPATIMLFGTGLIGLACMGRRRMRKK